MINTEDTKVKRKKKVGRMPGVNLGLSRTLLNRTVRTIEAVSNGELNIKDLSIREHIKKNIQQIYTQLGERKTSDASLSRKDLEQYLSEREHLGSLNTNQVERINRYVYSIVEPAINYANRLHARSVGHYVDGIRQKLDDGLSSIFRGNEQKRDFESKFKSRVDELTDILKGEGKKANGKRARKYTERVELVKQKKNEFYDLIDDAYTHNQITRDEASKMIDGLSSLMKEWTEGSYLKRKYKMNPELKDIMLEPSKEMQEGDKYLNVDPIFKDLVRENLRLLKIFGSFKRKPYNLYDFNSEKDEPTLHEVNHITYAAPVREKNRSFSFFGLEKYLDRIKSKAIQVRDYLSEMDFAGFSNGINSWLI